MITYFIFLLVTITFIDTNQKTAAIFLLHAMVPTFVAVVLMTIIDLLIRFLYVIRVHLKNGYVIEVSGDKVVRTGEALWKNKKNRYYRVTIPIIERFNMFILNYTTTSCSPITFSYLIEVAPKTQNELILPGGFSAQTIYEVLFKESTKTFRSIEEWLGDHITGNLQSYAAGLTLTPSYEEKINTAVKIAKISIPFKNIIRVKCFGCSKEQQLLGEPTNLQIE